MKKWLLVYIALLPLSFMARAQELDAKVIINSQKISNTMGAEVFEELRTRMQDFLNDRSWTELQFKDEERINCSFNITINKWNDAIDEFECTLLMSSTRPVYNSSYNTTVWSVKDDNFCFKFEQADQLEFSPENIHSQLVALIAYYAYMIIGMDMETFSLKGGQKYLETAEDIVNKSQDLGYEGWKPFDNTKNRFGLLNDYLDGALEGMRILMYEYHRKGLDQMTENADKAREAILKSLDNLDAAHRARTMSSVPQLFTEYKRDEIINIFSGKGTTQERNRVYDILFSIDPSSATKIEKIKK